MCQTLSELRVAVAALAQRFDPALVPPAQLAQVVGHAGAIEKMMATIASLAAARLARCGPAATGPRQAARELAQASGTSLLEAAPALSAASEPAEPVARAGALSRPQLGLVAGAVAVNRAAAHAAGPGQERVARRTGRGGGRARAAGWAWKPGGRPCTGPGPALLHRRRRHRPPARPGPARGRGPGHGRHRPPGQPRLRPDPAGGAPGAARGLRL